MVNTQVYVGAQTNVSIYIISNKEIKIVVSCNTENKNEGCAG